MMTPKGNIGPLVAREDQFTLPTGPSLPMVDMAKGVVTELGSAENADSEGVSSHLCTRRCAVFRPPRIQQRRRNVPATRGHRRPSSPRPFAPSRAWAAKFSRWDGEDARDYN